MTYQSPVFNETEETAILNFAKVFLEKKLGRRVFGDELVEFIELAKPTLGQVIARHKAYWEELREEKEWFESLTRLLALCKQHDVVWQVELAPCSEDFDDPPGLRVILAHRGKAIAVEITHEVIRWSVTDQIEPRIFEALKALLSSNGIDIEEHEERC